jgi:hypothetical protein
LVDESRKGLSVTLTEFLLARITEQEIRCRTLLETQQLTPAVHKALSVALRDCKAKRRIIDVQTGLIPDDVDQFNWELMALADVYSDHPDWREEWAP